MLETRIASLSSVLAQTTISHMDAIQFSKWLGGSLPLFSPNISKETGKLPYRPLGGMAWHVDFPLGDHRATCALIETPERYKQSNFRKRLHDLITIRSTFVVTEGRWVHGVKAL